MTAPISPISMVEVARSDPAWTLEKPPARAGYRVIWDCVQRRWGYTRASNLAPGEQGYGDWDRLHSTLVGPLSKPLRDSNVKSLRAIHDRAVKRMRRAQAAAAKIGPQESYSRDLVPAPLTADEHDDLAAGIHYERSAYHWPPLCICGNEWICPVWIEQEQI